MRYPVLKPEISSCDINETVENETIGGDFAIIRKAKAIL